MTVGNDNDSYGCQSVLYEFANNLILNQEPLGAEFEKVLHDNLWDLYDDFPVIKMGMETI